MNWDSCIWAPLCSLLPQDWQKRSVCVLNCCAILYVLVELEYILLQVIVISTVSSRFPSQGGRSKVGIGGRKGYIYHFQNMTWSVGWSPNTPSCQQPWCQFDYIVLHTLPCCGLSALHSCFSWSLHWLSNSTWLVWSVGPSHYWAHLETQLLDLPPAKPNPPLSIFQHYYLKQNVRAWRKAHAKKVKDRTLERKEKRYTRKRYHCNC